MALRRFALFVVCAAHSDALVASWYDTGARLAATAATPAAAAPAAPVTPPPAASSHLFEEGKATILHRESTQASLVQMLKVRALRSEGAAVARQRAMTQLRYEGMRAIHERESRMIALAHKQRITELRLEGARISANRARQQRLNEGLACVSARRARQAECDAKLQSIKPKAVSAGGAPPPAGFEWGATF